MSTSIISMPELPPTLNEIIGVARRNKFASSALKRRWHKKICPYASEMNQMSGKVYIECVWIVKNRRRDPDNISAATKYIFDTMVEQSRIDNDNLKVIQSPVIHHYVIGNYDGFILYVRDKEDFLLRMREDISVPPNYLSLLDSSGSIPKLPSKRVRSVLKSNKKITIQ